MVLIYTVSYGTIAGTWLPKTAILNLRLPSGTFFIVSYGTIGDIYKLHCSLWNYRRDLATKNRHFESPPPF
jgi:hypothetical protein